MTHEQDFLIRALWRVVKSRERGSKWYADNLEKHRANRRKWQAANPEKVREYSRKHRAANLEKVRESSRKWVLANPEKIKQNNRKRRARQRGSAEHFDHAQWTVIKMFYGNQCVKCHRSESALTALGLKLVPDHVVALANGGSNDIGNIQPLCSGRGGCNNRKGVKHQDYRPRFQ